MTDEYSRIQCCHTFDPPDLWCPACRVRDCINCTDKREIHFTNPAGTYWDTAVKRHVAPMAGAKIQGPWPYVPPPNPVATPTDAPTGSLAGRVARRLGRFLTEVFTAE